MDELTTGQYWSLVGIALTILVALVSGYVAYQYHKREVWRERKVWYPQATKK